LEQLHWLPSECRIQYKIAIALLTFKARTTEIPSYLLHLLSSQHDFLHSSLAPLLTVPYCKTELGKRAYRVAAPTIWNSLTLTILTSRSVAVFKTRLKHFYLTVHFACHVKPENASASTDTRLAYLWRCINVFIIIIIIIIIIVIVIIIIFLCPR
jgi:hypothetical protein